MFGSLDGFVYRLAGDADPWETILEIGRHAEELGASVHLRVAGSNPAEAAVDDHALARRVAAALVAALTQPGLSGFVDTFADNDRGYFVRNGVVDRRFNPRPAYHVIRNLHGALNTGGAGPLHPLQSGTFAGGRFMMIGTDDIAHALILPEQDLSGISLPRPPQVTDESGRVRISDLLSGKITTANYRTDDRAMLEIAVSLSSERPILLTLS